VDLPTRPSAVLVLESNPLFERPQFRGLRKRLEETPFLACVSPFLDETARLADVVLPAPSFLEIWRDSPAPPLARATILGLTQPVVVPARTQGRSAGDLVLELARALGGKLAEAFPWPSFEAAIKDGFRGVYEARRGAIFDAASEETWVDSLAARGWWYPSYTSFDDFWRQVTERGGWWDPVHVFGEWARVFRTPSGKFEFRSSLLEAAVRGRAKTEGRTEGEVLASLGFQASAETAYLPHHEPPRLEGDPKEYPLILRPFPLLTLRDGTPANLPFLQEIPAPEVQRRWDSWVEITPETAGRLGLRDEDTVRVESPAGSVRTRVVVVPGGPDDVAGIPIGQGHTASSAVARGRGVNPLELLPELRDPLSGVPARTATRVRLVKE
jgi:anaerobic selenocysteine-containing dehydrogenase